MKTISKKVKVKVEVLVEVVVRDVPRGEVFSREVLNSPKVSNIPYVYVGWSFFLRGKRWNNFVWVDRDLFLDDQDFFIKESTNHATEELQKILNEKGE